MYNKVENTHGTVRREVLYAYHPWFAHEVWVHAVIEKADGVFFRCTLDGAEADCFLEIPAWMFERACYAHGHVTRDPFVSMDALMALSSLLDLVLKTAIPSSNTSITSISDHPSVTSRLHQVYQRVLRRARQIPPYRRIDAAAHCGAAEQVHLLRAKPPVELICSSARRRCRCLSLRMLQHQLRQRLARCAHEKYCALPATVGIGSN